ncbi:MAG: hypothetical protein IJ583_10110 [Firmicutes bacterium]|nr:hypothetical protein [Bacillota bacterium]
MRVLFTDANVLNIIEAVSVYYEPAEKAVIVTEMAGDNDYFSIPMDKKRYEKDVRELLKTGFIDWSEFETEYNEDETD